jgi:hypothetical protein
MDADRNLLFAVLALEKGLIDQDQFKRACTLWISRRPLPLARVLVDEGFLTPEARVDVERLIERRLWAEALAAGGVAAGLSVTGMAGRNLMFGRIGRGGMGEVFKGRDPDLGRELAVKVLREDHGDWSDVIRRFVEEAQVAGQLQHPGIAPVYEMGWLTDGGPTSA